MMKKNRKQGEPLGRRLQLRHLPALILALLTAISLMGCGSSVSSSVNSMASGGSYYSAPQAAKAAADYYAPAAEYAYETTAAAMADGSRWTGRGESGTAEAPAETPDPGRKLIKTVNLSIETKEMDLITANITQRITELGGYVQESNISTRYGRSAYIVARIPSSRLNEFITKVEAEGNITNKSENVSDITLQYSDTQSHIRSLEVERERLLELMEKAEDIDTIVAIEDKLSQIRYQLDSYESQIRLYDNQVDYSTVTINIDEVQSYTPPVKKGMKERISTGFKSNLEDVGYFLEDLVVWIASNAPGIALFIIFLLIIWMILRGLLGHSRKKREKREAARRLQAEEARKAEEERKKAEEEAKNAAIKQG